MKKVILSVTTLLSLTPLLTAIPSQAEYREELQRIDAQLALAYQDHAHIGEELRDNKELLAYALKQAGENELKKRLARIKVKKQEYELLDIKQTIEVIITELKGRRDHIIKNMKKAVLYEKTMPNIPKTTKKTENQTSPVPIIPSRYSMPSILTVRRNKPNGPLNRAAKRAPRKHEDHLQLDTSKIYEQNFRR